MHLLASLPYTEIELHWEAPVHGPSHLRARQLRGALARAFAPDSRFHQRDLDGRPIYRYPRIQYRWRQGRGVVVGWLEGAAILRNLPWLELDLSLGQDQVRVSDAIIGCRNVGLGLSPRLCRYWLESPVLLFNQDNFPRFLGLESAAKQDELDRLLTAQLLTALRRLEVDFPTRLYAGFVDPRSCKCRYKQQDLLGFTGRILTNAVLPSGFAFGHAVSHGYGWLVAESQPPF